MPAGKMNARVRPDRKLAEVTILAADDRPLGTVLMTAAQLETFISGLAELRAAMLPEVAMDFPGLSQRRKFQRTKFFFGLLQGHSMPVLAFRDSGLGWLGFGMPLAEVQNMCREIPRLHAALSAPQGSPRH